MAGVLTFFGAIGVLRWDRMGADRDPMKRWVASRRAAQERERAAMCGSCVPVGESIGAALELIGLMGRTCGSPVPVDPVTEREETAARHAWVRLHAAWRR